MLSYLIIFVVYTLLHKQMQSAILLLEIDLKQAKERLTTLLTLTYCK